MAREENYKRYDNLISDGQENQIYLERLIKHTMESPEYQTNAERLYAINSVIDGVYRYKKAKSKKDASREHYENHYIELGDFNQFVSEYHSATISGKIQRAAEILTAFVVKIIPKTLGMAMVIGGTITDAVGTAAKMVARNLPIGDIGATANHYVAKATKKPPLTDKDAPADKNYYFHQEEETRPLSSLPKATLGLVSGAGKAVSEVGSNIAGAGIALQKVARSDISSPVKRLAKKARGDKDRASPRKLTIC